MEPTVSAISAYFSNCEQHRYYWKPTRKLIQLAALYILTMQEPRLYRLLCGRTDMAQEDTCQIYLSDMALRAGNYLLYRGEQLSCLIIHEHIQWAMFFAEPLVREICPSAIMPATPKLDWMHIYHHMFECQKQDFQKHFGKAYTRKW